MYPSDYGKKGGTSATAGKTASLYEVKLPDHTVARKRSFHVHLESAYAGCYLSEGKWEISAITPEPRDWGTQVFLPARRISD